MPFLKHIVQVLRLCRVVARNIEKAHELTHSIYARRLLLVWLVLENSLVCHGLSLTQVIVWMYLKACLSASTPTKSRLLVYESFRGRRTVHIDQPGPIEPQSLDFPRLQCGKVMPFDHIYFRFETEPAKLWISRASISSSAPRPTYC